MNDLVEQLRVAVVVPPPLEAAFRLVPRSAFLVSHAVSRNCSLSTAVSMHAQPLQRALSSGGSSCSRVGVLLCWLLCDVASAVACRF